MDQTQYSWIMGFRRSLICTLLPKWSEIDCMRVARGPYKWGLFSQYQNCQISIGTLIFSQKLAGWGWAHTVENIVSLSPLSLPLPHHCSSLTPSLSGYRTTLIWIEILHVVSRICWSHSSSLGGVSPHCSDDLGDHCCLPSPRSFHLLSQILVFLQFSPFLRLIFLSLGTVTVTVTTGSQPIHTSPHLKVCPNLTSEFLVQIWHRCPYTLLCLLG